MNADEDDDQPNEISDALLKLIFNASVWADYCDSVEASRPSELPK